MEKMIKKRVISTIYAVAVLILCVFSLLIYTMIDDNEISSQVSLAEYNNLFDKEAQGKLQILVTVKSRHREPNSMYVYDKKYNLSVFKAILSEDVGLTHIISFRNEASNKSFRAFYEGLPSFNFDIDKKAGKTEMVSALHFKFSGDSIQSIAKNDNLFCYYFRFNSFSISYNNLPNDIVAKGKESNIPASVVFKKEGKFLYIIIMTIAEGKVEMQADQLYRILK